GEEDARVQERGSAQRFLSTHAATYNTFNVQRHLISARTHQAFRAWRSARRQAGANPRSRRCSCQSCGRFLESITSRVGVSSTGCWPTRIARTISGERLRETHEHLNSKAPISKAPI